MSKEIFLGLVVAVIIVAVIIGIILVKGTTESVNMDNFCFSQNHSQVAHNEKDGWVCVYPDQNKPVSCNWGACNFLKP